MCDDARVCHQFTHHLRATIASHCVCVSKHLIWDKREYKKECFIFYSLKRSGAVFGYSLVMAVDVDLSLRFLIQNYNWSQCVIIAPRSVLLICVFVFRIR